LDAISKFSHFSQKARYWYPKIVLSGGEPLQWENILDGLDILRNANITGMITMQTSLVNINKNKKEFFGEVLKRLDEVRVSSYGENQKQIQFIRTNFGEFYNACRILYVGREMHIRQPEAKQRLETIPADCGCVTWTVYNDGVDSCGSGRTMMKLKGIEKIEDLEEKLYHVPFGENFLKPFLEQENTAVYRRSYDICQSCVANKRVVSLLDLKSEPSNTRVNWEKFNKQQEEQGLVILRGATKFANIKNAKK
jgi:hypothetical protein